MILIITLLELYAIILYLFIIFNLAPPPHTHTHPAPFLLLARFTVSQNIRRGVRGRLVKTCWLRITYPFTAVGSKSRQRLLDSFMWGSYPASLRNVGVSTQVLVRAWNNSLRGTWGLPPLASKPGKLPYNLYSVVAM